MGLAYVASACTGNEPCAINEDGGLVLGIVVAHEMGHVYVFSERTLAAPFQRSPKKTEIDRSIFDIAARQSLNILIYFRRNTVNRCFFYFLLAGWDVHTIRRASRIVRRRIRTNRIS
jgi:hypothetical protein